MLGLTIFGASSCDVIDPYDPGTNGETSARHHDKDTVDQYRPIVSTTGVIKATTLFNGNEAFEIVSKNGTRYLPVDLPAEFAQPGMHVRFSGIIIRDMTPPTGERTMIELHDIASLHAGSASHRPVVVH